MFEMTFVLRLAFISYIFKINILSNSPIYKTTLSSKNPPTQTKMKTFAYLAAVLAMAATTAFAQSACIDRCQQEFVDCFTQGGTFEDCERLRGTFIMSFSVT